MKTAEMWLKAQMDDRVYKCDSIRYSRTRGFYDCSNKRMWSPSSFSNYTDMDGKYGFEAFMILDWEAESLSVGQLEIRKLYYCNKNHLKYEVDASGKLYYIENDKNAVKSDLTYNEIVEYEFWEAE